MLELVAIICAVFEGDGDTLRCAVADQDVEHLAIIVIARGLGEESGPAVSGS